MATNLAELYDATVVASAVHGDPDVGWAAITPDGDAPEVLTFHGPDFLCPSCGGDYVATEDDGTASCDTCGATGVTAEAPDTVGA